MSFRIFAAGTGDFGLSRNYTDEGDAYDLASALNRINSLSSAGSAIAEEIGSHGPDNAVQTATRAVGTLVSIDLLRTNFLLAHASFAPMRIAVTARDPGGVFSTDTVRHVSLHFSATDHQPFRYFMEQVTPVLEGADLNRFRVLAAMAEVFARWSTEGGRANGAAMLNFEITST